VPRFHLKNKRLLEVSLQNEKVLALAGSMVAYDGNIKFEKSILGGQGLLGAFKRAVTNEGVPLMLSSGNGSVFFARNANEVTILELHNEKLFVESSSLLVYEQQLKVNVTFKGLRGVTSGQGLFTTTIEGSGNVAVTSHGHLIALEVTPQHSLSVDPDAFVAYSGNVNQEFIFDVNWKNLIGQGSGESFQHRFSGQGVVYIQPSERK
jgi:uncharacterized protein (AIM24 family)